jgi:hypothetical protein
MKIQEKEKSKSEFFKLRIFYLFFESACGAFGQNNFFPVRVSYLESHRPQKPIVDSSSVKGVREGEVRGRIQKGRKEGGGGSSREGGEKKEGGGKGGQAGESESQKKCRGREGGGKQTEAGEVGEKRRRKVGT